MKVLEEYSFNVWADAGMMNFIKEVAGVTNVFDNTCSTQYHVFLDPRYNRDFVKKEIEAVIVCADYDNWR
jgi:16S rRNA G966 N2-methylase RsmD